MHVELAAPVLVDGRWDVSITVEFHSHWWGRPLLLLALEYAQHVLRHRYPRMRDRITARTANRTEPPAPGLTARKIDQAIHAFATAWNDTMPELTAQSPTRLAHEKVAGLLFRTG
jgi:hypothetical protein